MMKINSYRDDVTNISAKTKNAKHDITGQERQDCFIEHLEKVSTSHVLSCGHHVCQMIMLGSKHSCW